MDHDALRTTPALRLTPPEPPTTRGWRARPALGTEALALGASLYFALVCNATFLASALAGRDHAAARTWVFAGALLVLLTSVHLLALSLVLTRHIARPLLALLFIATGFATYFMRHYGVVLDPTMLRNVMRTNPAEAGELLGPALALHLLLVSGPPLLVLWRVQLPPRPLRRAALVRLFTLGAALAVTLVVLLAVFQDLSALMRNQKSLRYLITPANLVYSSGRVLASDARGATQPRLAVGTDAKLGPAWAARKKPALFVVVVGETARAANWGLNGYTRQTTPKLATLDVLNFSDMTACGTNTETSVPCMFSAIGRRDYDEDRIRGSESLLHVLKHAGFNVLWRDNQSGCKGVCADLPEEQLNTRQVPGLCEDGRCFDEILLDGLDSIARDAQGNLVLVLHTLGNHGPAYSKRYPDAFRRYTPTCDTTELQKCSTEQIVNAYDNGLLYTDHLLARTIEFLKSQDARFDTAMLYVSDHGESLGERGLYLHGIPYPIAPREQLKVPMVWWLSPAYTASFGIDRGCLAAQTAQPWSHDQLFHSVLGLLDVRTSVYEAALDVSAPCRR